MAILEHEVRLATETGVSGLHRHLLTRSEYYALSAALQDKRIELIEGELIEMAPIGPLHAAITQPISEILGKLFGPGYTARNQVPVVIGDDSWPSEPEPDVAVVVGSWRDYASRLPGPNDVVLIVEVSDSSLNDDRKVKSAVYASAGIPEYWIVNLLDKQVEVYREPSESGYASATIYRIGEIIEPLYAPDRNIAVADIML